MTNQNISTLYHIIHTSFTFNISNLFYHTYNKLYNHYIKLLYHYNSNTVEILNREQLKTNLNI